MSTLSEDLKAAVLSGDKSNVTKLLKTAKPKDINNITSDGWTVLCQAAEKGLTDMVKLLLEAGASANLPSQNGWTPALLASKDGHIATLKLLVAAGADVDVKNKNGVTPLKIAAENGHADIARVLLEAGADSCTQNKRGYSALISACAEGTLETVKLLLAAGADVHAKEAEDGWTALMFACQNGHIDVVKLLLNAGADLHYSDKSSRSALMMATKSGRVDVAQFLMAVGADVHAQDKDGWTPLMYSCVNGHASTVEALLAAGADMHAAEKAGETVLMMAAQEGHTDTVKLLIGAGADVRARNESGVSALIWASTGGHTEVIASLLASGAVVNAQSKNGNTALKAASQYGHIDAVKLLLAAGADIEVQNEQGWGPLFSACVAGNVDIVKLLLAAGADKSRTDLESRTVLMLASMKGQLETAQVLVAAGAELNARDKCGYTALMYAATEGYPGSTQCLVDAGADLFAKSNAGQDARALAAEKGYVETLSLLVAAAKNTKQTATPAPSVSAVPKPGAADAAMGVLRSLWQTAGGPQIKTAAIVSSTVSQDGTQSAEKNAKLLLAAALQHGSKEWKRSKFSLLGQGRAGKTAFANAIAGRPFVETESTVGIQQLTCSVKNFQFDATNGVSKGNAEWSEGVRCEREFETALAAMMVGEKLRSSESGGNSSARDGNGGGDIRAYMKALSSSTTNSPAEQSVETHAAVDGGGASAVNRPAEATSASFIARAPAVPKPSYTLRVSQLRGFGGPSAAPAVRQQAPAAVVAETAPTDKPELDEEMVMKMLATMQDAESGLLISLFDFGGQSVFEVIHHLFLTRNGVYALVFNMEWLLNDGPDKERALRFMRNWLSSIAVHTFNKTTQMTAPIVLVGTRLDTVFSPATHGAISLLLHEHFSDNLAWRSVIANNRGRDQNGRALQWFFPADNKQGKKGSAIKHIMATVNEVMNRAEYTHKEVPLTWFKAIDQMADTKKDCLSLQEVVVAANRCSVSVEEVPLLLAFLHDMGHLMWLDEPGLRDVVILDPVAYLVAPATIIICKLTPDHEDTTHHFMDSHRECERLHKREWMQLKHDGVLSVKLLPILWEKYQAQSEALQMLMVKFGLLVPLRTEETGAAKLYLVPTLLSAAPQCDPNAALWLEGQYASCYFVFTLSDQLGSTSTLTESDLKSAGFLPGGMFERIVGKALSWSQDTAVGCTFDLQSALLHKDMVVLAFGRQRFRLVHCADIHCVRVDVEGANPVGVQQKLQDFIARIIDECMKSLLCFPAVAFKSASEVNAVVRTGLLMNLPANELLIPLQQLRKASKGESMLVRRGGHMLMSLPEIKSKYGQWLQLYDLRERYDVFLSYRWGRYDSEFTEQLFDVFTNLSVGAQSRAVEVFLDRKRLQEGRLFKSDFAAALTHALVVVPVMSVDALGRMVEHDPTQPDNVLLEWIMILESFAAGKILKVFPILFGKRAEGSGLSGPVEVGVTVSDFFADSTKDRLPKIPPTATLTQAADLLSANGIEPSAAMGSYTVHSVVHSLLQFLLCKASDFPPRQLVGGFAEKVVRLLGDCGEAALDAVISAPVKGASSTAGVTDTGASQRIEVPSSAIPTLSEKGSRPLKSLTVEEVGRALAAMELGSLVPIFAEKRVTGKLLLNCEEVSELMSEDFGVTSKVKARTLMQQIVEWRVHGVSGI